MAEYLCTVVLVSNLFLAIRLRYFYFKFSFFDGSRLCPSEKTSTFAEYFYNRVSKTRLWHSTARPTLAA